MKFCLVVPEICRGQVHGSRKERRRIRIIIIQIIRNGAKTISLQMLFGRLNNTYICTICIRLNTCFMSIPRCALRDKVMLRLSVNDQVFTESYLPFDYDAIFLFLLTFSRYSSGCRMEIWLQHISKRRYIYIWILW